MIPSKIRFVMLCAALAACADKTPKTVTMREALPNLPLPPGASFVSRAGGPDALQITLRSSAAADVVVAYYRNMFKSGGWQLLNDAKDAEGATVLLAQQKGPPLWVRIRDPKDGRGTLVELSGAVVAKGDTAAQKPSS